MSKPTFRARLAQAYGKLLGGEDLTSKERRTIARANRKISQQKGGTR